MRERMKYVAVVVAMFVMLMPQTTSAVESVENLFEKYIQLNENFDPSVAELYSDDAKIHMYRRYPHGIERAMEFSGAKWKQLLIKTMPLAKAQNDKSVFSKITITNYGNSYKIKANRYSNRKCYTDTGYYMMVAPTDVGRLQITEEYIETQPQSDC